MVVCWVCVNDGEMDFIFIDSFFIILENVFFILFEVILLLSDGDLVCDVFIEV